MGIVYFPKTRHKAEPAKEILFVQVIVYIYVTWQDI